MTDVLKQYQGDAVLVAFTTNLFDALAIDEYTAMSDEIPNTSNYPYADLEVYLGSALWVGADSAIELYIAPSVDGTNYPEWAGAGLAADEQENNQFFIGSVTTAGGGTVVQRLTLRDIELPAGKFKLAVRNKSGVILNATNTLKFRYWAYKSA